MLVMNKLHAYKQRFNEFTEFVSYLVFDTMLPETRSTWKANTGKSLVMYVFGLKVLHMLYFGKEYAYIFSIFSIIVGDSEQRKYRTFGKTL